MAIVINGSGTVTGISVGGLPDGIVDAGTLATNSVDSAELVDGSIDTAHIGTDQITSAILPAGSILQVKYAAITTNLSTTSDTFQSLSESCSITPTASNSKILILINIHSYTSNHAVPNWTTANYKVLRDTTEVANSDDGSADYGWGTYHATALVREMSYVSKHFIDAPGDTSAHTYYVQVHSRFGYDILFNSYGDSSIILMEVAV